MNFKYLIGKAINEILLKMISKIPSTLFFIPNGRFMELDIVRTKEDISLIFDVGANVGQTAMSFVETFPNASIHSFEPILDTYNTLSKKSKNHPNIKPIQSALGAEKGTVQIILNSDSQINSIKNKNFDQNTPTEQVFIETGKAYCEKNNINQIDLLKIDTEGFEISVLKGFEKDFLKDKVKFIYCEVGFNKNDPYKSYFSDVENYIQECGFVVTGFYEPSRWGKTKMMLGFCNALFTNSNRIDIF